MPSLSVVRQQSERIFNVSSYQENQSLVWHDLKRMIGLSDTPQTVKKKV